MNMVIMYVFVFILAGVNAMSSGCKDEAGNEYADGDSFLAADGCNRCVCSNETIACTGMACPEIQVCVHNGIEYEVGVLYQIDFNRCWCLKTGEGLCPFLVRCPPKVCETEDGKMYAVGEQFLATDGCNLCTCTENGSAICTLMACVSHASE